MTIIFTGCVFFLPVLSASDSSIYWHVADNDILLDVQTLVAVSFSNITPTLYAGTWGNGIYGSTDHGTTWIMATTGITLPMYVKDGLAVNPVTPTTLFAGDYFGSFSGVGVYRSTNGGISWTVSLQDIDIVTLLVHPVTPTLVLAGTREEGLYRSTNNGDSWQPSSLPASQVQVLAAASITPGILYAGASNELYTSANGGISWRLASTVSSTVTALGVHPLMPTQLYAGTRQHGLWRSADGGATWLTQTVTGLPSNAWVTSIAIDSDNPTTLYASVWTSQVYRSFDGGASWGGLGYLGTVEDVLIHPDEPSVIYAATSSNGVFRGSTLDHLTVETIENPQYVHHTFPITLTARDALGFPLTGITQAQMEILARRHNVNVTEEYEGAASISAASSDLALMETLTAGGFNGTAILIDNTQTITPTTVTFVDGIAAVDVAIAAPANSDIVTATVPDGPTIASVPFDVIYAPTVGFRFDPIADQVAGVPFSITLTARDELGFPTAYSGTVILTDTTGTLAPLQAGPFVGGVWSGQATITRAHEAVILSATGDGLTGTSQAFAVAPNDASQLVLLPNPMPDQTASMPFPLTVQALDAFANPATQVNDALILADSTGTLHPVTTMLNGGLWHGSVTIQQPQRDVIITATLAAPSGDIAVASAPFDVGPPEVTGFTFDFIPSQIVDIPFLTTIRARNALGLPALYTGTNTLVDTTGTVSPTLVGPFVDGVWTGEVTITQSGANVVLMTNNGTLTSTSNSFTVAPNTVSRLFIAPNPMPDQIMNIPFTIVVLAEDQTGDLATHYNGSFTLSDSTGTLQPVTATFSGGIWGGSVTIDQVQSDVVITAAVTTSTGDVSATSTYFDVNPTSALIPMLSSFTFDFITDQIVDIPFTTTITARDTFGQHYPYTGTNILIGTAPVTGAGTLILPQRIGPFVDGVWSGAVQVTEAYTEVTLITTNEIITGNSNPFAVVPNIVNRLFLAPNPMPDQTAGEPFPLSLTAEDPYGNLAIHYNGAITLTDSTGTLHPVIVTCINGVWSGAATIDRPQDNVIITVSTGTAIATSTPFDVIQGGYAGVNVYIPLVLRNN